MNLHDKKHILDFNFRHKRRNCNARNEQSIETLLASYCNKILIWIDRLQSIRNNKDFRMINRRNRDRNFNQCRKTYREWIDKWICWCIWAAKNSWCFDVEWLDLEELVDEYFDVEWLDCFDAIDADCCKAIEIVIVRSWLMIAEQLMQLSFANWIFHRSWILLCN